MNESDAEMADMAKRSPKSMEDAENVSLQHPQTGETNIKNRSDNSMMYGDIWKISPKLDGQCVILQRSAKFYLNWYPKFETPHFCIEQAPFLPE